MNIVSYLSRGSMVVLANWVNMDRSWLLSQWHVSDLNHFLNKTKQKREVFIIACMIESDLVKILGRKCS